MKIMICGKGGCGKSTITVLLAKALAGLGRQVLVVDADESNLCLPRLLGMEAPEVMMDAMGGRPGTREKLKQAADHHHSDEFFKPGMRFADLPTECVAESGTLRLLMIGKIKAFGEGCACMIGGVTKAVLGRLQEEKDDIVLVDAEAGLEHFGRQIDKNCDMVLFVIDPSHESINMAARAKEIAREAGVEAYFILNKVDVGLVGLVETMQAGLDAQRIVATIPRSDELFMQSLKGEALNAVPEDIDRLCDFVTGYKTELTGAPVSLTVL